ncbi:diguanylate cyclase domain-containing protein [Pontixanthobacter gangjinensis]|uniref:Diguanylate cyclase n=1 Tax=Pontixanthobacter gangjinensis TaxID=1028742 RepID=A0A6I4SMA1_9SPHN|nr:diguanylate cyclase [Pontixanthobacter gangjinensis]MXO56568.1 diguanylate cyclase [Pontixanthobacter gangjinensis]
MDISNSPEQDSGAQANNFGGTALAVIVDWWRPILAAIVLCGLVIVVRPSDSTDRRISDRALVGQSNPADPSILLIEISGEDVRKYGRPALTRENLTVLVNRIAEGKPKRLMIDLYLGEGVSEQVDSDLAIALSRLGPQRVGLVTSPGPDDVPLATFAQHGAILDARLTADGDGWHRQLGSDTRRFGNNPAAWLATGEEKPGKVALDLRIAHQDYRSLSVDDVLNGSVNLTGKTIILSSSPDIAPTRAYLPMADAASRGSVLAVATQSVAQDYAAVKENGYWASLALQLIAIALGLLVALKAETGKRMFLLAAGFGITLLVVNLSIATSIGSSIAPTQTLACFLVMLNVTVVQRLKIIPMVSSFIKGDVSPEEAWAWRSCEASNHPALLFSAGGKIKRHNAAAEQLVGQHGSALARLCLPRYDDRAKSLVLAESDGQSFEVDWPYGEVPIAVLRDNTAAEEINRDLREQLYKDDLTGCTNRRGFDRNLIEAGRSGEKFILFFIDMNGFKQVNDTYGHDAGDELLVATAGRLQNLMRQSDVLARLGGDEFGVIMFGTENERFATLQERRMVDALSIPLRLTSTDEIVTVGAAIGHAIPESPGEEVGEILRRADLAMYRNKADLKRQREAA